MSWTDHADQEVKYFSGAATYRKNFRMPDESAQAPVVLDLGRVEAMARVVVNDREFPTLWKPPYRIDISPALKPGENALRITVINTWKNRLVGDASLPPERRRTRITAGTVDAGSRLQPAGLLGPVTILLSHRIQP